MGKKKYIVGGALAAAAGYLYMKYRDDVSFEYEAEFETEVEVVEPDTVDESEGQHDGDANAVEVAVEDADDEHDEEEHDEQSTEQAEEDEETDDSGHEHDATDYDALVEAALDAIDQYAVDGTNVYAVEPYDEDAEGTPLSKYDELKAEPDIVISSFAGRNLMFVVADDERLEDHDELRETIQSVAEKAGFSVLLVIPATEDARERAAAIEEDVEDVSLYVKTPDNIEEAL